MFSAIDTSFRYRSLVPLKNRSADQLYWALDKVFRFYNKTGHTIATAQCDQEFKPLMEKVEDELQIDMNYTTTGEHENIAERNNRTIQDRIRAEYHRLPYKMIPKLMLTYLAMVCTSCINWFPAKGGISSHCSPHVLLNQRDVDYKKHCTIALGQYVQAHNDPKPKNTNAPRTLDAIYLRPSKNKQGGHELMDLSTGRLITRCKVKKCPITPMVIKAVETMAAKQGMTSLKFTNRVGVPLHPSDWIPGVDFMDGSVSESDDASYTPSTSSSDENEDFDDSSADDESLDAILAEPPRRYVTPAPAAPVAPPEFADPVPVVTQDEEPAPTTRRSTRIPPPRIRIAPTWTGQHHGNTLHQTENLDPTELEKNAQFVLLSNQ